ncbi:MAG: hypothetical protein FWF81_02925 [Defluviitaleaceae bacterium]|nr:hypothetical protein [Defluviitaleaceae bacterium]
MYIFITGHRPLRTLYEIAEWHPQIRIPERIGDFYFQYAFFYDGGHPSVQASEYPLGELISTEPFEFNQFPLNERIVRSLNLIRFDIVFENAYGLQVHLVVRPPTPEFLSNIAWGEVLYDAVDSIPDVFFVKLTTEDEDGLFLFSGYVSELYNTELELFFADPVLAHDDFFRMPWVSVYPNELIDLAETFNLPNLVHQFQWQFPSYF